MKTAAKDTKRCVCARIFVRIQNEIFKNGSHFAIMDRERPEWLIVRRAN